MSGVFEFENLALVGGEEGDDVFGVVPSLIGFGVFVIEDCDGGRVLTGFQRNPDALRFSIGGVWPDSIGRGGLVRVPRLWKVVNVGEMCVGSEIGVGFVDDGLCDNVW